MHRLFDDYRDRTHMDRNIPRTLSLERTLSQVEQFWAYMIWLDENGDENDIHHSVLVGITSPLKQQLYELKFIPKFL